MKNLQLKQAFIFLFKSVVAGLAVAFVLLYYFPEFLATGSGQHQTLQTGPIIIQTNNGSVSYNQAVAATAPAVANVYASKVLKRRLHPLLQDPIFRRFFGDQGTTQQRNSNLGSGVIMSTDGHLITNAHVIKDADEILITLADGRQSMAQVVGVDTDTDLAVLQVKLDNLPSISIGNSDNMRVGDVVLAIGNPYDFGQTVTQGIVSATGRKRLGITTFEDFIQTDADINPGNSGGALITATGQLIGINTAIISNTGGSQGIGLAIPINMAVDVMRALIDTGHVVRGWLGITIDPIGSNQSGVLVVMTHQGGPAETAGIMPGDILAEVNGEPLFSPHQALRTISQIKPGSSVEIVVLRGWKKMVLQATVWQRPTSLK